MKKFTYFVFYIFLISTCYASSLFTEKNINEIEKLIQKHGKSAIKDFIIKDGYVTIQINGKLERTLGNPVGQEVDELITVYSIIYDFKRLGIPIDFNETDKILTQYNKEKELAEIKRKEEKEKRKQAEEERIKKENEEKIRVAEIKRKEEEEKIRKINEGIMQMNKDLAGIKLWNKTYYPIYYYNEDHCKLPVFEELLFDKAAFNKQDNRIYCYLKNKENQLYYIDITDFHNKFNNILFEKDPREIYPVLKNKKIWESARKGEITIGMTEDIVVLLLGNPTKINKTTDKNGVSKQYVYSEKYLYFHNNILKSINE